MSARRTSYERDASGTNSNWHCNRVGESRVQCRGFSSNPPVGLLFQLLSRINPIQLQSTNYLQFRKIPTGVSAGGDGGERVQIDHGEKHIVILLL